MRNVAYSGILLLVGLLGGCGSLAPQGEVHNVMSAERLWVKSQGGYSANTIEQQRAETLCKRMASGLIKTAIHVRIVNSAAIGAWSWPDGDIDIATGLMQRLNNGELCAAIAHEMGHLINDHHVITLAALTGQNTALGREAAADRTACHILIKHGLPMNDLIKALCVVRRCCEASSLRASLTRRISLIAERERRYTANRTDSLKQSSCDPE